MADRPIPGRPLTLPLPRDPQAPGLARRRVRAELEGSMSPEQLDDLLLMVSELVTNAVVHGEGAVELRLRHAGDRIHGEVVDEGGGFEHRVRECGIEQESGRGLVLVASLADRWGIHEGTTHVWFEMSVRGGDDRLTRPRLGADEAPPAPAGR